MSTQYCLIGRDHLKAMTRSMVQLSYRIISSTRLTKSYFYTIFWPVAPLKRPWIISSPKHEQTCSNKKLTDNRSILFPSRSGFRDTFVHDAQDFPLCHWNIIKVIKPHYLILQCKISSVSLSLELTSGLLDSLHDHLQRQAWDLHVSLEVE